MHKNVTQLFYQSISEPRKFKSEEKTTIIDGPRITKSHTRM